MVSLHSIFTKNQGKRLSIGIASAASGLGATHLCIALANYLVSKKGYKTACLEFGQSNAFEELKNNCAPALFSAKPAANRYFKIYDVDYYPNVKKDELPALSNAGYDVLILDFGVLSPDNLDEFYRCDQKLLLNSAASWRRNELTTLLSTYPAIKDLEFIHFMVLYATRSDMHKIAKVHDLSLRQLCAVPFLPNPFHIGKEQFSFFEGLI